MYTALYMVLTTQTNVKLEVDGKPVGDSLRPGTGEPTHARTHTGERTTRKHNACVPIDGGGGATKQFVVVRYRAGFKGRRAPDLPPTHNKHIITRIRIQTAGVAFGRHRSVFLSC